MRNIAVVGTGYVGLVTGTALSEMGHHVTCIDIDESKIEQLKNAISPIYEPGLEEMMKQNIKGNRLHFTTNYGKAIPHAEVVYIAVGTPENKDGTSNLSYVYQAAKQIAEHMTGPLIISMKSTVPVGTTETIKEVIQQNTKFPVEIVFNPEFLREGSALYDVFNGDRIVIGSSDEQALALFTEINESFGIPIVKTDVRSAEMIKYASNAFLATKISFINEIASLCDQLGANIDDVADGMGRDKRIGRQFLNAGIGYGGSCFPKDTKALLQLANSVNYDFSILKAVTEVNDKQNIILLEKAKSALGSLNGYNVAILGLSFKPDTDDMREAPSIVLIEKLLLEGAQITAYDPIAIEQAKKLVPSEVNYATSSIEALTNADAAFVVTEWSEFKQLTPQEIVSVMKKPIVFDGRNCFDPAQMKRFGIQYYSIGRPS